MNGIALISHANGWSCSNEAKLDADKHLVEVDGKKFSKNVITIKINSIFDTVGNLHEGQSVECLFKDDNGYKKAFVGTVKSIGKLTTVIHELYKSDRYTEILNKIKS